MRILFVSRAFPPTIGGIEQQNADLARFLGKASALTLIANTRGKSFLPFFLPYALVKVLLLLPRHDVLLLGDGVLAPIGAIAKYLFPRKIVTCVVHGLDLTFFQKKGLLASIYGSVNIPALRSLDSIVCVSQATKDVALTIGLSEKQCRVIPNGIDAKAFDGKPEYTREALGSLLKKNITNQSIILRLGRFVEHKGVEWFIRNVVPKLPDDVLFVAAGGVATKGVPGDDSFFPRCQQAIRELHLENRVTLLTNISQSDVQLLLHTADVAVAPNIPVPGTMEGFGISVLEASVSGLPIVVSRLEGLQEAVHAGKNGIFAEAGNALDFTTKILAWLSNTQQRLDFGARSADFTREHFDWSIICRRYTEHMSTLVSTNTNHH